MIFGLIKTKKDRELEVLKRALWVFRGVVANSQTLKGGNLIVKEENHRYLLQVLIDTCDIDCLPKGMKKKKKPKSA